MYAMPKVFVSSTYEDLQDYRNAVHKVLGNSFKGMELFGSQPQKPLAVSLSELEECEIYIGIIGKFYGTIDEETGKSITQREYERAVDLKLDPFIYYIDESVTLLKKETEKDRIDKLDAFKKIIDKKYERSKVKTPKELAKAVKRDIGKYLKEEGLRERKLFLNTIKKHNEKLLKRMKKELPILQHIERPETKEIFNNLQNENALLVKGAAGIGKSGIIKELVEKLESNGIPVFLLNAVDLQRDEKSLEFLEVIFPFTKDPKGLIKKISETCEDYLYLIIDQLDSVAGTTLCNTLVNFLQGTSNYERIKVVAVSRDVEASQEPISKLEFVNYTISELSEQTAKSYLVKLGIKQPDENLIEIAGRLLDLSLIAEIVSDSNGVEINILQSRVDLWEKYIENLKAREGENTTSRAFELAEEILSSAHSDVSEDSIPRPILNRLLSRQVLVQGSMPSRVRFRHEEIRDFLYAWNSTVVHLKMPGDIIGKISEIQSRAVIQWMQSIYYKYRPEKEAQLVKDLLIDGKDSYRFYTRTVCLDNLIKQLSPHEQTVKVVARALLEEKIESYFFRFLSSDVWLSPLKQTGYFANPPSPIPGKNVYWHAMDYLEKVAPDNSKEVGDILLHLRYDNPNVVWRAVKIAPLLNSKDTAKLVHLVKQWLDSGLYRQQTELGDWITRLVEGKEDTAALELFNIITTPLKKESGSGTFQLTKAKPPLDEFFFRRTIIEEVASLIKSFPIQVFQNLQKNLITALDIEGDIHSRYSSYLRRNIANTSSHHMDDFDNTMIDCMLRAFEEVINQVQHQKISKKKAELMLKALFESKKNILIRLGFHLLYMHYDIFPELSSHSVMDRQFLLFCDGEQDYLLLARKVLPKIGEQAIEKWLSWVLEGKENIQDEEEERLKRRRERFLLKRIHAIKDYLPKEIRKEYSKLAEQHGDPEKFYLPKPEPEARSVSYSSPLSVEKMMDMEPKDVIELIIEYCKELPMEKLDEEPCLEGLQRVFLEVVKNKAKEYSESAMLLNDPALNGIFISGFFSALKDAVVVDWYYVFKLIRGILENQALLNKSKEQKHWFDIRTSILNRIADLLEKHLRSEFPSSPPIEMKKDIYWIIAKLLQINDHTDEIFTSENMGPLDKSSNCLLGNTFHLMISTAIWIYNSSEEKPQQLDDELKKCFEEVLLDSEASDEIKHCLFGEYLTNLYGLDKEWLISRLDMILPMEESKKECWEAAWYGYVVQPGRIFPDIFKLLSAHYNKAIISLKETFEKKSFMDSSEYTTDEGMLAQHLMIAYCYYEGTGGLLELLFSKARDSVRSVSIETFIRVLEQNSDSKKREIWEKGKSFWKKRVEEKEAHPEMVVSKEFREFTFWIQHLLDPLPMIFPLIEKTLMYAVLDFRLNDLIIVLGEQSIVFPKEVINLLYLIQTQAKYFDPWIWHDCIKPCRKLLSNVKVYGASEDRDLADKVISHFGEKGMDSFKDLL